MATYDTSGDLASWLASQQGTGAVSNALLGKDTAESKTSSQDTTSTSNTAQTGTSAQNTSQSSTQSGSQATTGAQTSTGTTQQVVDAVTGSSGTQSTTGTNTANTTGTTSQNTSGTTATTGTIGTTGSTSQNSTSTQSSTADISGLQTVLSRQLAGLTPEALQAIFQEGSKNVPSLVATQANALGARVDGNTPLAKVMRDLNVDLTNKAALASIDMLNQAGTTAANIAANTKSTTTSNSGTEQTSQMQTQNLLNTTSQQAMTEQVQQAITQIAQQVATQEAGTSKQSTAGTQTQATTSQQDTLSTQQQQLAQAVTGSTAQNTAQTQTQNVDATQQTKQTQQQVFNSNLLGKVAGAVGTGIGLTALYKAATGSSALKDVGGFIKTLIGQGASLAGINKELAASGLAQINANVAADQLSTYIDSMSNTWQQEIANLPLPDVGSAIGDVIGDVGGGFWDSVTDWLGFADGGHVNFADGGQPAPMLAVPNLLKDVQKIKQQEEAGVTALLDALGLGAAGIAESMSSLPAAVTPGTVTAAGDAGVDSAVSGGSTGGESFGGGSLGFGGDAWSGDTSGSYDIAPGAMTATPNTTGKIGDAATALLNLLGGPVIGLAAKAGNAAINNSIKADTAEANHNLDNLSQQAWAEGQENYANSPSSEANMDAVRDAIANEGGQSYAGSGDSSDYSGSYESSSSQQQPAQEPYVGGGNPGSVLSGMGIGGSFAGDSGSDGGGEGYAAGGLIQGPGTGISDSIPAQGPGGRQLRVSNGEYIIPADTVRHFGTNYFDKLIEKTHTPAAQQRGA